MNFMPHRYCLLGNHLLIALCATSDILIMIAYLIIPVILMRVAVRVRPIWASWNLLVWFGVFLFFCAMTHLMDAIVIWYPYYWVSAGVKVMTALASLMTAWLFGKAAPKIPKHFTKMIEQSIRLKSSVQTMTEKLNVPIS